MAKRIITISINHGLVEEVDETRGNMPRSEFIERLLFLFFHKGESIREIPKEEIAKEVAGYV